LETGEVNVSNYPIKYANAICPRNELLGGISLKEKNSRMAETSG
jgi:hypothetical protein